MQTSTPEWLLIFEVSELGIVWEKVTCTSLYPCQGPFQQFKSSTGRFVVSGVFLGIFNFPAISEASSSQRALIKDSTFCVRHKMHILAQVSKYISFFVHFQV